jgi:hypothetical protein
VDAQCEAYVCVRSVAKKAVQIPLDAWDFVLVSVVHCIVKCQCDSPIPHPEESQ